MDIVIEPLHKSHHREAFDCGVVELNQFLKKYAHQNQKNSISKTFVAIDQQKKNEVLGFYTLASGHIHLDQLPKKQKHPEHPVSIARLARLAVDLKSQGNGIGSYLLYDALQKIKAASNIIGIFTVVVDAKDEKAKSFYERYGFIELQNPAMTLFLPMKTINKLFS